MDARIFRFQSASGVPLALRPLTPDDREGIELLIAKMSAETRYLRFFSSVNPAPKNLLDRLSDIDGINHIAWGAIDESVPEGPIIGVVRVVKESPNQSGEFSMALRDDYHGQGIARLLILATLHDCIARGTETLKGETLSENRKAKALLLALGARAGAAIGATTMFHMKASTMREALEGKFKNKTIEALANYLSDGSNGET